MVRERNVADSTTNGGGESSSTGNTLLAQDPSTSNMVGLLKNLVVDNASGANGRILIDLDSETIGTALGAVADMSFEVGAAETVFLTDADFGEVWMTDGAVAQASNAATSLGYKFMTTVEWFR